MCALDEVARAGATIADASATARNAFHYFEQIAELRDLAVGEGHEFDR